MRNFTKTLLATALCMSAAVPAMALTEYEYSFVDQTSEYGLVGFETADHFDVGIMIPGNGMVDANAVLKKFQAVVPNRPEIIKNFRMWVSYNIQNPGKGKEFRGDVFNLDDVDLAPTSEDLAVITCDLPEAISIPAEGVFMGYSFDVPKLDGTNVAAYPILTRDGEGQYCFLARAATASPDWMSSENWALCITATLEGEFLFNAARPQAYPVYQEKGTQRNMEVKVTNDGINEISSVEYTVKVGSDYTSTDKATLRLAPRPGVSTILLVPMPTDLEVGLHNIEIVLDKVNNESNTGQNCTAATTINVLDRLPVKHPVMEEFTGTWCGFCPRGMAGMQACKDELGEENFIGIAYHASASTSADPMMPKTGTPNLASGYPCCVIDRKYSGDPYYGISGAYAGAIVDDMKKVANDFTPAEINLTLGWNEENRALVFNTTTNFVMIPDDGVDYRIAFVVIENGMTGTASGWTQSNYYSGNSQYASDPYLKEWVNRPTSVKGLEFNDVCVFSSGVLGVSKSLPKTADLEVNTPYTFSYEAPLNKFLNSQNQVMLQDLGNCEAIAMIIKQSPRGTGTVMNAVKVPVSTTGIRGLQAEEDCEVVGTAYYDLSGRQVANPAPGVYVKSERLANGRTVSSKVVVK